MICKSWTITLLGTHDQLSYHSVVIVRTASINTPLCIASNKDFKIETKSNFYSLEVVDPGCSRSSLRYEND